MSQDKEGLYYGVLYRRRWLMLIIFSCCSAASSYHWIHLNIISDRVMYLWNVSIPGDTQAIQQVAIDWLSMIYLLAYIPLIVPATWFLDRYGLRTSTIVAVFMNALGGWLKCVAGYLAVNPAELHGTKPSITQLSGFPVLMFAQTLDAIAQLFILGVPAQLAATWFGEREISTATSIGVLANQLGVAIGFGIPPIVVPSVLDADGQPNPSVDFATIHQRMMYLLYVGAAITTLPAIPVLICFKSEPPKPPTYAQFIRKMSKVQTRHTDSESLSVGAIVQPSELGELVLSPNHKYATATTVLDDTNTLEVYEKQLPVEDDARTLEPTDGNRSGYKQQLWDVLKNVNFMLLLVSYGMNTGVYYAWSTLLNPILAEYFGGDPNIGWIGFTMVIAGILGSVLAGIWLDRTKKYRLVIVVIYAITLVWMCGFTGLVLLKRIDVTYVASFFLGLTMTGFLPIGFEFAAELTYPANEGLTSGLINASAQLFGIIFTTSASHMMGLYEAKYTNTFFTVLILVGFILLLFIKEDLRRYNMQKNQNTEAVSEANKELANANQ